MLQNPCKTLGFKKNMVYKIPPGGGGKPYPTSGLFIVFWMSYYCKRPVALPHSAVGWSVVCARGIP